MMDFPKIVYINNLQFNLIQVVVICIQHDQAQMKF